LQFSLKITHLQIQPKVEKGAILKLNCDFSSINKKRGFITTSFAFLTFLSALQYNRFTLRKETDAIGLVNFTENRQLSKSYQALTLHVFYQILVQSKISVTVNQ